MRARVGVVRRMAEVAVRVGKQTKWISGLTEKTTCKVSSRWRMGEQHRLQTIYELDAAPALALVQNLLETGFPSRLAHYAKYFAFRLIQINTSNVLFLCRVV